MMNFKHVLVIATLIGTVSAHADTPLPHSYQYPTNDAEQFTGTPATVDLSSYKDAKRYRTKLEEGAKIGPNFAGHFTIVTIGCGTQCQQNWLINAQTGKILSQFPSVFGLKYQLDSNLLIINPPNVDLERGYKNNPDAPFWDDVQTSYVLWKENKFETPLYQDKWVNVIKLAH